MVLKNNFLSTENCWRIMLPGNLIALQILRTKTAKTCKWSIFASKKTCFFQKPVAAFLSRIYQSLFGAFVKTYENVICCIYLLLTQTWSTEHSKKCIFVWLILIIKFFSFSKKWADFFTSKSQWTKCGTSTNFVLHYFFLTSETLLAEMASKCKISQFFLKIKPFVLRNYWLHFVHQGINWNLLTC